MRQSCNSWFDYIAYFRDVVLKANREIIKTFPYKAYIKTKYSSYSTVVKYGAVSIPKIFNKDKEGKLIGTTARVNLVFDSKVARFVESRIRNERSLNVSYKV